MKDLEESTLLKFANLYWTRVIQLREFVPELQESFKIGPDVAEEVDKMYRIDVETLPEWTPLFYPQSFQQEHSELRLKDWVMNES